MFRNIEPSDTYKGLLKQFGSLKNLLYNMEKELQYLRKKDYYLSEKRLNELEEALASEREANSILTEELEKMGCDKVCLTKEKEE